MSGLKKTFGRSSMKYILTFALVAFPVLAKASMTKPQIIDFSAKYVVYWDESQGVAACSGIDDENQMVECLKKNVTLDDELSAANDTEILEGLYELVYKGRPEDCFLRIEVNAKIRKVTYDSEWNCDLSL